MQLSNSGRVVIIDDHYKEAKPLMQMLGKKGVPYLYFDGSLDNLPVTQIQGVRFIFLDIQLAGMESSSPKGKASSLVGIIKKIVPEGNGPFVIIFWTKHQEVIKAVMQSCKLESIEPVAVLELEKIKCIREGIDYIADSLKECFKDVGAYQLYIEWENIINNSVKKQITELTDCFDKDGGLHEKTEFLFYKLSDSFNNNCKNNLDKIKSLFYMLNRALISKLEEETNKTEISFLLPDYKSIPQEQFEIHFNSTMGSKYKLHDKRYNIRVEQSDSSKLKAACDFHKKITNIIGKKNIAKLNRYLLVNNNPSVTGNVYIAENRAIKEGLLNHIFKLEKAPSDATLCKVLITPECDLAQNKTLLLNGEKVHRVIYGIMHKSSSRFSLMDQAKDARFHLGPIWYNNHSHRFIFHYGTISLEPESELPSIPIFSLRRDLVFDLQSKAANHVNRLGNLQLSE